MVLRTKVNKGRSGLFLQPCGPESYEVALDDYAGLKWGDDVEIRVVEVDHARRSMRGELIRKI